jgi:hypothetical protein
MIAWQLAYPALVAAPADVVGFGVSRKLGKPGAAFPRPQLEVTEKYCNNVYKVHAIRVYPGSQTRLAHFIIANYCDELTTHH